MERAFKNALKGRANNNVIIDKNGISTYAVAEMTKRNEFDMINDPAKLQAVKKNFRKKELNYTQSRKFSSQSCNLT